MSSFVGVLAVFPPTDTSNVYGEVRHLPDRESSRWDTTGFVRPAVRFSSDKKFAVNQQLAGVALRNGSSATLLSIRRIDIFLIDSRFRYRFCAGSKR